MKPDKMAHRQERAGKQINHHQQATMARHRDQGAKIAVSLSRTAVFDSQPGAPGRDLQQEVDQQERQINENMDDFAHHPFLLLPRKDMDLATTIRHLHQGGWNEATARIAPAKMVLR
jgi:hypothetical protein